MLYIMSTTRVTGYGWWHCRQITLDDAKAMLGEKRGYDLFDDDPIEGAYFSVVGHHSTAQMMSDLLQVPIRCCRHKIDPRDGDQFLCFKLKERPPEGMILSAEQLSNLNYEWVLMTYSAEGAVNSCVKRSHLCFCMRKAYDCGVNGHPQKVMKELGIAYQHATPQSIADQWWFWNCENIPQKLPEYLEVAKWDPMKMIGFGLGKKDAEAIRDYQVTPTAI